MNKNERKTIYILLISIIICSSILMYKIKKTPEYDQEMYEQIYKEYEQISNISDDMDLVIDNNVSKKDNTIYVTENASGNIYYTIATITIPKINISYPIINEYTEENINIAPAKLLGPEPNEVGNFVIVGHNNWNEKFFSELHKLEKNDIVVLGDQSGEKMVYKVYDKYEIKQDDFNCLEQTTDKKELTLITCVKYKKIRDL